MTATQLGRMQLLIMQVLWSMGRATAREITDALNETEAVAHSTVQTLLRGLEDKGSVSHRTEGRTFVFFPLVEQDKFQRNATRDLLERAFAGNVGSLVAHLLKNEQVSAEELREMRRLIDERSKKKIEAAMNDPQMLIWLLDGVSGLAQLGLNWFIQSTVLLGLGLFIGGLLRRRGSAAQSVVYRTTLVAVLLCPAATWALAVSGVSGWSIDLPATWVLDKPDTAATVAVPASVAEVIAESDSMPPISTPPIALEPENAFVDLGADATQPFAPPRDMPFSPRQPLPATSPLVIAPEPSGIEATTTPAAEPALVIQRFGFLAAVLCLAWLFIATLFLARFVSAWRQLARIRRSATKADAATFAACRELASLLRVFAPDVRHSPFLPSPCLAGLRQPVVLLPEATTKMPVRDALIHELAHLRRRDCHWNLVRRLATAIFFYQPLLWWLSLRLEATAEEVCDDYVVQLGGDRQSYAHRLVDIAELHTARFASAGVNMVSLRSLLAKRVARIMDTSRSLSTRVGSLLLALVIIGGLVGTTMVGLVGIRAQSSAAESGQSAGDNDRSAEDEEESASQETNDQSETAESEETLPATDAAPPTASPTAEVADSEPRESADGASEEKGADAIRGRVFGAKGRPVAGAKFYWFRTRVHDIDPMPPRLVATTDDTGRFVIPEQSMDQAHEDEPASWDHLQWIVVRAPGHGVSIERPGGLRRDVSPGGGFLEALARVVTGRQGATIQLPAPGEPLRGRLVNIDGQPVAGATVRIRWYTEKNARSSWERDAEVRDPEKAVWRSRVSNLLDTIEPAPLRQALPMATTNDEGVFLLRDIGPDRLFQLLVEGEGIESTEILARNERGETVEIPPERHADGETQKVYANDFLHVVGPSKPVLGRVTDIDSGEPIARAVVRAYLIHGDRLNTSREREQFATRTDAEGRYRITGLPVGDENNLVAFTTGDIPYVPSGHPVDTSVEGAFAELDFRLKRGTWAEGRVYDAESDQAYLGEISYYFFLNSELEEAIPGIKGALVDGAYWTNANGEFRVPVLPSRGILAYRYDGRYDGRSMDRDGIDRYPAGYGAESIEGADDMGGTKYFRTRPWYLMPSNYRRVAEVHPSAGQATIRVDLPLVASRSVTVRVVDGNGQAVNDYSHYGAARNWGWQPYEGATFEVKGLRPGERRKVFIFNRPRNLAGSAIVDETQTGVVEIQLRPAGSLVGRIVDPDGEPIIDATITTDYEKLAADDDAGKWAAHPKLLANPSQIPVDNEGRFRVDGLIPGMKYSAHASAPRRLQGIVRDMGIGSPFRDASVQPGEVKDLGDLVVGKKPDERKRDGGNDEGNQVSAQQPRTVVTGRITGSESTPVANAHVAAIGLSAQVGRGGDLSSRGEVLATGTTNEQGQYELTLRGVTSKTHHYASVIARKDGMAIAWQKINLDARSIELPLELAPEEPITGRLVDIEGQPAAGVQLRMRSVTKRSDTGTPSREGVGYRGNQKGPAAWLPPVTTDEQGRFTLKGIAAAHGVFFEVVGNDRFAPQDITLNTGMPEQRGERDGTYRSLVKNLAPGEEAVLPLAPAQLFEGLVTFEDTGEPAPYARLTIWASQQEFGSMISVAGKADAKGRYRISPRPGIRFGVTAYPPDGTAYLARRTIHSKAIRWTAGDRVKQVNMTLPRGVLVHGKVVEEGTESPVANAAIQYEPESANNPYTADDILTGWQDIQLSGDQGEFEIAVLPGPGRLLVHGQQGEYVLQLTSGRELSEGKSGGQRNYAHAVHKVDPAKDAESIDVTIRLQRGVTVSGRIVDEQGQPVDEVLVISRLTISPYSLYWRGSMPPTLGGEFTLPGLDKRKKYPVYFLNAKRRIGATATISADDANPVIVLKPCGEASARFVDGDGRPHASYQAGLRMVVTPGAREHDSISSKLGVLEADADFVANVDRTNYWPGPETDDQGRIVFPALVPGATYRLAIYSAGQPHIKDFSVAAGEQLDLGEFSLKVDN